MSKKRPIMPLNDEEIFEYMTHLYVKNEILKDENEQLRKQIQNYEQLIANSYVGIEEKEYWKSKAMTLLMQVRRLTSRMTAKEVIEFGKELEDE